MSVPEDQSPTTVFLVDDHEVVRRGVTELLEVEPDLPDLLCLMLTSFTDDRARLPVP